MQKIELLDLLTRNARQFRKDSGHYKRNDHMHDIKEAPTQEIVDAVLTGFINHVGLQQGVDYALYASDLKNEEKDQQYPQVNFDPSPSNLDMLREHTNRLKALLDDAHPGLSTWVAEYGKVTAWLNNFWNREGMTKEA